MRTILSAFIAGVCLFSSTSLACTRAVYLGENNQIITARSMDWKRDVGTNLWILPQGMQRDGATGDKTIHWKSKYGSVIATGYDIATTDGMNEKGLDVNMLWLVESVYPTPDKDKSTLSISVWGQYVLDNFATVEEAVTALEKEPFTVITDNVPGEKRMASLHMSISDPTGDSAIIEYIDGKQIIHHNRKYQVLTNSPAFDQQLALDAYWKSIGGTVMLPGTNRAADRFARASFYINAIPKKLDDRIAVASVFSVIRNASVPFGINTENEPNISSTRWRTLADQKNKRYFFESALTPNIFWVDLNQIDFSEKTGKVKKLDLGKDQTHIYSGNATASFKEAPMFKFLSINKVK
ncbi:MULTISPECIES: linear amide C-N hydrolase [Commensalibacter]|uniref:Ntn superfamily (YxeI) (PDB:2BJF) n=2 Tax=Commensalibacter TaxID=1079922 RepID=A0ABM9HKY3_9PROT|nr:MULTISPECIES: linear amide C-N hydrolase [Commensalibacter]EUK19280.1 putative choloylglycine hydrolase protein [Commensalibacter papalotli (ex Servin-Garciduenas et al. 2014)]CAI3932482.1 Ntn superfamily (YxeI) (PDB:2BJF) [Commensalibacter papalotli (ex Botero et al. 2024)]CAI3946211.1 Ntn superfamily (YxeI) (PDB:2BJF) [Commensalibacter papalotli (ex Botero et al. 2024)]